MNAWLTAVQGFVQPIIDAPVWILLLVKVTAILLAAWLAHLALWRANPRWRVLLWRVTAVGLIALPAVSLLVPALEIRVKQPAPASHARALPAAMASPLVERGSVERAPLGFAGKRIEMPAASPLQMPLNNPRAVAPSALLPNQPPSQPALAAVPPEPSFTWPAIILAVWLSGTGVFGFRLCLGHYRIGQMVRCARQAAPELRGECLRVARTIGCRRRVELLQSAEVESPFLCGLFRPLLLLPARMGDPSYSKDLPGIFAHELGHLRSRDVFWNLGLHLLSIVLWFHPLAWRMRKAHLVACELVCDAVSASFVGDVNVYCRTLARVAVDVSAPLPTAGFAMARVSTISRRLNALRNKVFHSPLRRRSILGFGISGLLAVAMLGVLQFASATPPAAESVKADKEAKSTDKTAKPDEKGAKSEKDAGSRPKTGSMKVIILDPQGKPLRDANIHANICYEETGHKVINRDYKTGAAGVAPVEMPKTPVIVRLWASKKPFVTMFSHWEQNELAAGKGMPEEYSMQLETCVTAGGRILDEHGKPIAGVKVQVQTNGGNPVKGDARTDYDTWLATGSDSLTTDADGRWRIDNVPNHPQATLSLLVSHPDYISDEHWGGIQKENEITTAMLLQETATMTMKCGVIVQGRVTDPSDKPIKDAIVVLGDDPYGSWLPSKFPTDADGRFRLPAPSPGETSLTVIAPGFAPQLRHVKLQYDLPPQDFRMESGKPIQLRFVDVNGKPLPNVDVSITEWKESKSLQSMHNPNHPKVPDTKIPDQADAEGVWQWNSAPDVPVKLRTFLKGFTDSELEIAGGAPPKTITLKAAHRITGSVTDSATGKPIPTFTIIPVNVFRKDWHSAERGNAVAGGNGQLDYLATRTDIPLRLRVEAAGYRTQTGPEFRVGDDTSRTQNFALLPSKPISGILIDADGKPVAKAEVQLAIPTEDASYKEDWGGHKSVTDETGRFEFPHPDEPFAVMAHSNAGFALAHFTADQRDVGSIRLQPWASIHGQFSDGGQPVKDAQILLGLVRIDRLDRPRVDIHTLQAVTDKAGRFEFPRVPPLPITARVYLGPWKEETFHSGPSVPLNLQRGQKVELNLGSDGVMVKGKVKLTGKVPPELDCSYSLNHLISRTPGIAPPPEIAKLGFDIRNGWQNAWAKSTEGRAYMSTLNHWFVKLAPDGTFRISGVPPGEYDLALEIYAKPSGCLVDPLARQVVPVTVTAEDVARGELTLREISATVIPVPAIGDTPALSFHRADGGEGSLSDFRGHETIVHFWASWCGPCKQQLPALRRLQEKIAARGFVMLGLSLDDDAAAWQATLKELDLPWQQGRLGAAGAAGVSSVPAYWLLDSTGKIVGKFYSADELTAAIMEAPAEKNKEQPILDETVEKRVETATEANKATSTSAASQEQTSTAGNVNRAKTGELREEAIHGMVVDEQSRPVEGVTIRSVLALSEKSPEAKSDSQGRFEIKVPQARLLDLVLVGQTADKSRQAFFHFDEGAKVEQQKQSVRLILKPARRLAVRVIDDKDAPVGRSVVGVVSDYQKIISSRTDPQGEIQLLVPVDLPLQSLYAFKSGKGLDYLSFPKPDRATTGDQPQPPDLKQTLILKLTGAKTVRIRLIDPEGNPIEGIPVSPWYFQKPEWGLLDNLIIAGVRDFWVKTDAAGVAEFDWIPTWNKQRLFFWPNDSTQWTRWRINWDPEKDPAEITAKLQRMVPVRGEVRLADGSPAAGIQIQADGSYIGVESGQPAFNQAMHIHGNGFRGGGATDERGEFEIRVTPDCKYTFAVIDDKWVARVRSGILVRRDKPVENVDFHLQLGTRVRGQLTLGPEKKSWAGQPIYLTSQNSDDKSTAFGIPRWKQTDAEGRFDLCAGPGEYRIRAADSIPVKIFTVTDQKELVFDFNAPRKNRGAIVVRVVDQSNPPKPVPEAKVHGQGIYNMPGGYLDATTNAEGWFRTERGLEKMILYAFSKDNKLAGSLTISADDNEVTIPLQPVGSAKGQVIDQSTGKPAANLNIRYQVPYHYENPQYKTLSSSFLAGSTKTDAEGRFEMNDLVPEQKYSLTVPLFEENAPIERHRYDSLGEVQVASGETRQLGIVKFRSDFAGGELLDLVIAAEKPLDNRLKELATEAEKYAQRVLVMFSNPVGESHERLGAICKNSWNLFFASYYVISSPVDAGQIKTLKAAYEKKWGAEVFDEAWPLFCILDTDGKTLVLKSTRAFLKDGKVDDALLKEFLEKYALETPDAEKLLADAQAKAAKENKRIFLSMEQGVNQSPASHRLEEVLNEHRQMLEKDFIFVIIDGKRWKNGEAVIARIRNKADRSVPWVAILDPQAKVLATSDGPQGNFGYPSKPEEIGLFLKMLLSTAPRLTEKELSVLQKSFEEAEKR